MSTRRRHDEDAFTIVELLVALVLSLLVLSLVVGIVIKVFESSDRSSARTQAQRAAVLASEQLTSDLRAMRAPEREPEFTGSPDSLRGMILNGEGNLQVQDLLVATPTRIVFFAELANQSPDVECITWEVVATGAIQRRVRAWTRNCAGGGGALLQEREVMPPPATGRSATAGAIPQPFSYLLLAQRNPGAANIDPDACTRPTVDTAATELERNQVVGVGLNLRSFATSRAASGDQQLQTSVSIASRQGIDYRYALGCAA